MTTSTMPLVKKPHKKGCTSQISRHGIVLMDRTGRVGNGGIVAHDYRCNASWKGCHARVLVPEGALNAIAKRALDGVY